MISSYPVLLLLILVSVGKTTLGYTYRGLISAEDGHCQLEEYGFGKVKIGESAYNDKKCEQAFCENSMFTVNGCGAVSMGADGCKIISSPGHYPDCCPTIKCKKDE